MPSYTPTRHPCVYRYCLTFPPPPLYIEILENNDISQYLQCKAVLLVAGKDTTWVQSMVTKIRDNIQDLVYIALVTEDKYQSCEAENTAKRLKLRYFCIDFRNRKQVFECFWNCVEFCRLNFTWERRKWPLYAEKDTKSTKICENLEKNSLKNAQKFEKS